MKTAIITTVVAIIGLVGILEFYPLTLHWAPSDEPYIDIALIRKTGSNPDTYTFVKYITRDTPNTGKYTLFPPLNGLFEIECLPSPRECRAEMATTS